VQGHLWTKVSPIFNSNPGSHVCLDQSLLPHPTDTAWCSHILYAFANLKADSGEVFLSDVWSDKDIHHPGDSWNESGNNLYGNFKAIYNLKKRSRHLKVLLSIGGWTYSPTFHPIVVSPVLRAKFVESSIKLLEDYGLDGLDVDYEYPSNDQQAKGFVDLLSELRAGLNHHARRKGTNYRFLLTVCALHRFCGLLTDVVMVDRSAVWTRALQKASRQGDG